MKHSTLKEMKVHDEITFPTKAGDVYVLRVEAGWIYTHVIHYTGFQPVATSTFVPIQTNPLDIQPIFLYAEYVER